MVPRLVWQRLYSRKYIAERVVQLMLAKRAFEPGHLRPRVEHQGRRLNRVDRGRTVRRFRSVSVNWRQLIRGTWVGTGRWALKVVWFKDRPPRAVCCRHY